MVTRIAIAISAAILAGCVHPDYHCTSDLDCNVGEAGRCEADHRCTAYDPACPLARRYADHSGSASNECFDDQVMPANLCAAGQPPATPTGCVANVCDALPTCCTTGWSEPCVQQAQLLCDGACDTRIAITANKPAPGAINQLWDVRWDGSKWTAMQDMRQTVLAWLAPSSGSLVPRLAGFKPGSFVVDETAFPVDKTNSYVEATSVDFDRDGRATAALGFTTTGTPHLQLLKLDDGSSRTIDTSAATRLSWGDVDHDPFPDGIAADNATTRYFVLSNLPGNDHSRQLATVESMTISGGTVSTVTGDPPPLRSFDWIDYNGDHLLDAIAIGFSVQIHAAEPAGIATIVLDRFDCDPPELASAVSCDTTAQAAQAFAGAALPTADGPALVLASHPDRALYHVEFVAQPPTPTTPHPAPVLTVKPYTFPTEPCTTSIAGCPPILAVVIRDLDGDHKLDVIAIDADLQIYTSMGSDPSLTMTSAIKPMITPAAPGFFAVRTSVSGAPR